MPLACLVVLGFEESDWVKLLGIAGAMIALYVLARGLGGRDEAVPPPSEVPTQVEPEAPEPDVPAAANSEVEDLSKVDYEPDTIAEPDAPPPRNIRIIRWNFEHFDIDTGPPDPENFADDLRLDLYDASTGHTWSDTRFVATPAGLASMLRQNKWSSMAIPQTVVLSRYDVKEIRAAVAEQLGAIEADRGEVTDDESGAATAVS